MRNSEKLVSQDKNSLSDARQTGNNLPRPVHSPLDSRKSGPTCLCRLGYDTQITVGNAGDHPFIVQLFVQAYQSPLAEYFQSRLDEPCYEPSDRLLLRRGSELIGHVQVSKQI